MAELKRHMDVLERVLDSSLPTSFLHPRSDKKDMDTLWRFALLQRWF
jgi:hypothetical protein